MASITWDPLRNLDAEAWFRRKVSVPREEFDRLTGAAREKAFTVARVARKSVLDSLLASVQNALVQGQSLAEFKESIADFKNN